MEPLDATTVITNPQGRYPLDPSKLLGIAVHHSVTQMPTDASQDAEMQHIKVIDAYHASKGWGGFGYHLAVFPSGRVYSAGTLLAARAHVAGRNNVLIGICCIGDFSTVRVDGAQLLGLMDTLDWVAAQVKAAGATQELEIKGHKDWALSSDPTACPGTIDDIGEWETRGQALRAGPPPAPEPEPAPPAPPDNTQVFGDPAHTCIYVGNGRIDFQVDGVIVLSIGDPEEQGAYPGRIWKLAGSTRVWLRGATDAEHQTSAPAYWHQQAGD